MRSVNFVNSLVVNRQALSKAPAQARVALQIAWVLLGACVILGSAGGWNVESVISHLPPLCLFHAVTGIDCPGCGMTRAFLHLAHGDFTAAWSFHPFSPFVALLLLVLAWGPKSVWSWIRHSSTARGVAIAVLFLLLGWWIWTKLLPLAGTH